MQRQEKTLYVIIPAAGIGSRMGINDSKQFLEIQGVPVLLRTIRAFEAFGQKEGLIIHGIIVTTSENIERVRDLLSAHQVTIFESVVCGGDTRQESVRNGLLALANLACPPQEDDILFVHDGARCFVDEATLRASYEGGLQYPVCVASVPVKNTIKQMHSPSDLTVEKTLDRALLREVQTPQVFHYSLFMKAMDEAIKNGIDATDDTALAEAIGLPVYLTSGSYRNIKITTPEDVFIAQSFLNE
ncbi:MAG TPA: 2-C-methyl-D-erythritol 4-phosphate cytidylyltransferase [Bacillota bacterium]|nr:2-C-methyl-D-erythritol 4-phosphate cytidylyltransferase [Bacillota bacterium]HPE38327.1 2-C-methyl-D-erythritol 4-phosphate cytidylyltransferase [Bacillota bacterium]